MALEFNCPHCNTLLAIDEKYREMEAKCPSCGNSLIPGKVVAKNQRLELDKKREEKILPECETANSEKSYNHFTKSNTERNIEENPDTLLGWLSFLIPVIGFIMALIYVTRAKARDKKTARICFKLGFTGCIFVPVIVWGVIAIASLPAKREAQQRLNRYFTIEYMKGLKSALHEFWLDNGFYPTTEQGLNALVRKPTTGRIPENWKQYYDSHYIKVTEDGWENDYVYICPGNDGRYYDLISLGSDGQRGGYGNNEDISSWTAD